MSVRLTKNQGVVLKKSDPTATSPQAIFLGLGWTANGVDLDASAATFDPQGNLLELIYFNQPSNSNGSIKHSGDDITGGSGEDDERIYIDLKRIEPNVKTIVTTVTSARATPFTAVERATVRIVDQGSNEELCRFELTEHGSHTALLMAKIERTVDGEWTVTALGQPAQGTTIHRLKDAMRRVL